MTRHIHRRRLLPALALFLLLLAPPAVLAAGGGAAPSADTTTDEVAADAGDGPVTGSAAPLHVTTEHQGLSVEASVEPLEGSRLVEGRDARVTFRITDAHTGKPYPGLYPGAWLDLLPPPDQRPEESCTARVRSFLGGTILAQPEIDLNVYYVLALNDDSTLTVVDPLFGFGNTKLLDMVELRGPGGDWALGPNRERLFVSLPDWDRIAVVETSSWDVALEIPTGPHPMAVAVQPDGHFLWVSHDGSGDAERRSGVTVIDTDRLRVVREIGTGAGEHRLAFSDDGRYAFVTNRDAGTVSVIETGSLEKTADVAVGETPVYVAWAPRAGTAYVVDVTGGTVAAVDPEAGAVRGRVEVGPGLGPIHFAPGGRLAFLVHPAEDNIHILDTAVGRVIQSAAMEDDPYDVAFSDELAFVRHRGSDKVLMIPLDEIGEEGEPMPVVDFPGGQAPAGKNLQPTPAAGMVQAPGASAILLANAEDEAIYYYKEGMAAPMGHFRNYGRRPRAVMVVDRSLEESGPGVYTTVVQMRSPGDYQLALFLDAPRLVHCFPLSVADDPELQRRRAEAAGRKVAVELLTPHHEVEVGEEVRVRYRVTDSGGTPKPGLSDATALAFPAPGLVQERHPVEDLGDGLYEMRFRPDESGVWYVFLEIPSQGVPLEDSPRLVLRAETAQEEVSSARGGRS